MRSAGYRLLTWSSLRRRSNRTFERIKQCRFSSNPNSKKLSDEALPSFGDIWVHSRGCQPIKINALYCVRRAYQVVADSTTIVACPSFLFKEISFGRVLRLGRDTIYTHCVTFKSSFESFCLVLASVLQCYLGKYL